MTEILVFSVLGLGTGALIAGIAMGVVLTYRSSGVINIGMGATAMVSAYAFWSMRDGTYGAVLPTGVAIAGALLVALLFGLATELLVFRPLRTASPLAKLIASLGILLTAEAAIILAFGPTPKSLPSLTPTDTVSFLDVTVPVSYFILASIVVVVAIVVSAFLKWSMFGLETRAAFENEEAAMWIGLSPNRLSLVNTLLASLVVGGLGILVAPVTALDPVLMPLAVVPALVAALFANLTSVWLACAVGLAIGALTNVMYYVSTLSWFPTDGGVPLPGVQPVVVLVLMIIAVVMRGSKLPTRGDVVERALPMVPRPERIARPAIIAMLAGSVALIMLPFDFRQALINSIIVGALLLSLVVIIGYVGQVSVMQLALSGVTGFMMIHMSSDHGIGFPANAILGVLTATVLGVGMGLTALRVRGVQLALVTLAGMVAIERFWFGSSFLGVGSGEIDIESPKIFGFDLGPENSFRGLDGKLPSPVLGIVLLAGTIALCAFVAHVRRTNFGQQMVVLRSNERAASAVGIDVRAVKISAFALSSFIAGIAGVMYAMNYGSVSPSRFGVVAGLAVISYAYIGGIALVPGAVIGGTLGIEALFPHTWERFAGLSGTVAFLVGGIFLIFNLIYYPNGIAGEARRKRDLRKAGLPYESEFAKSGLARFVRRVIGTGQGRPGLVERGLD